MTAILVENLDPETVSGLKRRAAKSNRTVAEELAAIATATVFEENPRGTEVILSNEISLPSIHPWPTPTISVVVTPSDRPRLPDPGWMPNGGS